LNEGHGDAYFLKKLKTFCRCNWESTLRRRRSSAERGWFSTADRGGIYRRAIGLQKDSNKASENMDSAAVLSLRGLTKVGGRGGDVRR